MAHDELARLADVIGRHIRADGSVDAAVPGLLLHRASAPSGLAPVVYEPSLCVVAQGCKEVAHGGEAYRYDPAHALLVAVDLPVSARVVDASPARPCLVVRVPIDTAVVGELLADGANPRPDGSPGRALGLLPAEPQLLDAVTRLVCLLNSPDEIRPLARLILREITYRVLTGPQGHRLRQIAAAGAPAQRIAQAIRWLNGHFAGTLRVEELARQVGMSPSAFYLHFKGMTALSPLQYQKRLRLQEARRLMLGAGIDAAEAAYRVGYESPSQFGREYRRMFGAPPRQHVAAIKSG